MAVVLSGSFMSSPLQANLAAIVAPYTKTLHMDPGSVPFHLTDGEAGLTRLHQWQVVQATETGSKVTHRFPGRQLRGGFNRTRQDAFGRVGGIRASDGDDEVCAAMALALSQHIVEQETTKGVAVSSHPGKGFVVRCVRYFADAEINDDLDFEGNAATSILYEADIWTTNTRSLNLLKRTEPNRAAAPIEAKQNRL